MSVLRLFLLPFSFVYDVVMRIRNRMYNIGWKPSVEFDLPVISVGNLAVGGTGKTPMVEYLIRLISSEKKIATLSRGYGRKTKGFRVAGSSDNPTTIGDEPFQLFSKFKDRIVVSVGEDRAFAIPQLINQHEEIQVVLLDDAFQHRRVKPGLSILLTEYNNPFYNDYLMPSGRLRENATSASRADLIVVTKCPASLSEGETLKISTEIKKYSTKPIYFAGIKYDEPQPFQSTKSTFSKRVILVSGIANHVVLEEHVKARFTLVKHFAFSDHHNYTVSDLRNIENFLLTQDKPVSILTTEKDRVKLESDLLKSLTEKLPFFFLSIQMEFIENGKDFDSRVLEFVNRE